MNERKISQDDADIELIKELESINDSLDSFFEKVESVTNSVDDDKDIDYEEFEREVDSDDSIDTNIIIGYSNDKYLTLTRE